MDKKKQNARLRYTFATYMGANGLRCTPEREHTLNVILGFRGRFSAAELLDACSGDESMRVSRATVFNTLPLLEKAGIIRRMAHDRRVTYEVVRQSMQLKARQHLVCTDCGKVQRLQAPLLSVWVGHQSYRDFVPQPDSAVLYVDGLCNKCRRKTRIK
ncbi:MAG: transcriptional repressor [Muribaculaceae bacterium]|nr:transcriptional repressor [Muribaculaceae bacterium]MDE7110332.1 transcriptional repressor [Muribaculaceae bacterium]